MQVRMLLLVLLLSIAGCRYPNFTYEGENEMSIEYDPAVQTPADIDALAEKKCAETGRHAVNVDRSPTWRVTTTQALYVCQAQGATQ
jgi:hypothetical protein